MRWWHSRRSGRGPHIPASDPTVTGSTGLALGKVCEKRTTNLGRALPPLSFGQNLKEQLLFFGRPSLRSYSSPLMYFMLQNFLLVCNFSLSSPGVLRRRSCSHLEAFQSDQLGRPSPSTSKANRVCRWTPINLQSRDHLFFQAPKRCPRTPDMAVTLQRSGQIVEFYVKTTPESTLSARCCCASSCWTWPTPAGAACTSND